MKNRHFFLSLVLVSSALASLSFIPLPSGSGKPDPALPRSTAGPAPKDLAGLAVATFAGGCFWSFEETFEEVRGVTAAVSGYAGGGTKDPSYYQVGGGGRAESVQVYYNPKEVSYQQLPGRAERTQYKIERYLAQSNLC